MGEDEGVCLFVLLHHVPDLGGGHALRLQVNPESVD